MALHDDLLETARYLLVGPSPTQAMLRRSVSTAYYAVFHFLTHEACSNWAIPEQRSYLARAFEHKQMLAASEKLRGKLKNAAGNSTEKHLYEVALKFVQLYEKRELADYDYNLELSVAQVRLTIGQAAAAFRSWEIIRNEQAAQEYLFSLLIRERPAKSPEWD